MRLHKLRWPLLFLLLCVVYSPILLSTYRVNPDYQFIEPTLNGSYISSLFHFQTIDFQPIRDLTFFFDSLFGSSFSIFQNILYFTIGLYFSFKILEKETKASFWLLIVFALYPLFCPSIAWGVARKHLLAFLFIQGATFWLTRKKFKLSLMFFFFSLFSQPIHLLWVLWSYLWSWCRSQTLPLFFKLFSSFIFLLGFITNYFYYTQSAVFKSIYPPKTNQFFQFQDQLLAFGNYSFQLVFPYRQTLNYELVHPSTIIGLIFAVLIGWGIYKSKISTKEKILWISYGAIPLLIVLQTPTILSDNYLLLPAFAAILLALKIFPQIDSKKILIPTGILFAFFTCSLTLPWTSEVKFSERNFARQPNCNSARSLLLKELTKTGVPTTEARNFLLDQRCLDQKGTPFEEVRNLQLRSKLIFFDRTLTQFQKSEALYELGKRNFYPQFLFIGILVQENKIKEAKEALSELMPKLKGQKFERDYDVIFAQYIYPFCLREKMGACTELVRNLSE
jgi:hypothetical protein